MIPSNFSTIFGTIYEKTEIKIIKMKLKYLFFTLLFATSTAVFAQSDQKSKQILEKVTNEIKSLNSFYISFNMKVKNEATGQNSNQDGFGYVKGNKYYASLGNNVVISNGIKSWTVVKDSKVTYLSDVSNNDDAITPKKLMTIWDNGFKSKYDKITTLNGEQVHQISLYPIHPGDVNYHTIVVFISVKDNSLKKAIMKTKDGSTMTYTIKELTKNKPVNDTKFVYNPKDFPGYKLIRN